MPCREPGIGLTPTVRACALRPLALSRQDRASSDYGVGLCGARTSEVAVKSGHESQTAVMVCAARAAAHGRTDVAAFFDPTALELLPAEARERVERHRAGVPTKRRAERIQRVLLEKRTKMAIPRTVAIDGAI